MKDLKFEDALGKLESIVEGLEGGKISLEDSIKRYEEGIKLAKFCSMKLDEAEKKIEILAKSKTGKLEKKNFAPKENSNPKKTKKQQEETDSFLF